MNFRRGEFEVNLGLVKLKGALEEEDRQCAWELYTELSTRLAVTGKVRDAKGKDFDGEIYAESLESLYHFFREARLIMRKFPVGRVSISQDDHLGLLVHRMMTGVLRPFLEKWQSRYRHWWENESNKSLPPLERQLEFPDRALLLRDWTDLRFLMRKIQQRLATTYRLVDVTTRP